MIVIYEATEMTITYFNKLARKKKNLFLIKDFVIRPKFWYNLKKKVIWLDNEINHIKIKTCYYNTEKTFEI